MIHIGAKYTPAQGQATQKFIKNNYDSITVRVPKGDKDKIKDHAASCNESVNAFIKRAIEETMINDTLHHL